MRIQLGDAAAAAAYAFAMTMAILVLLEPVALWLRQRQMRNTAGEGGPGRMVEDRHAIIEA